MKNILVILLVVLGVITFVYMALRMGASTFGVKTPVTPAGPDRTIDITDIVTHPVVYSDLTLTINGHIVDWVTKNSFAISPQTTQFISGQNLLIIAKGNFKLPDSVALTDLALGEVANVKVTGMVKVLTREELITYLNVDKNSQIVGRWQNQPVMLADKIEKI